MIKIGKDEFEALFQKLLDNFNARPREIEPYWDHAKDCHYNHVAGAVDHIIKKEAKAGMPNAARFFHALNVVRRDQGENPQLSKMGPGQLFEHRLKNNLCVDCGAPRWKFPTKLDEYLCGNCEAERDKKNKNIRDACAAAGMCPPESEMKKLKEQAGPTVELCKRILKKYDIKPEEKNDLPF